MTEVTEKFIEMDMDVLEERCLQTIEEAMALGKVTETKNGRHSFIDRGGSVLGVAHLDTVSDSKLFTIVEFDSGYRLFSRAVDDRLGVYTILDYLPAFGIECDVLLTEGEESGNSTAQDFEPPKQYNWMFSFDRHGFDTVLYEYETKELKEMLKAEKIPVADGSFSDICYLEHLGCKGINFATGYLDEHNELASVPINSYLKCINQFLPWYWKYKDTHLYHAPKKYDKTLRGYGGYSDLGAYDGYTNAKYTFVSNYPDALDGFKTCTQCNLEVNLSYFAKGSTVCDFCNAKDTVPLVQCDFCGQRSRVTGFNDDGLCIFCTREMARQQMREEARTAEYLKVIGAGEQKKKLSRKQRRLLKRQQALQTVINAPLCWVG